MFLGYIHYFRALAITFIVAGHSIDAFAWADPDLERWLRIFVSNGSVLFVFIAGYLFQHLSDRFEPKKYYLSKLKNVIIPYLLVSIPAIAIFVTILERETVWAGFYDYSVWEQIGLFYLTGEHLAPLWFIPMIALYYLVAPILVKADKSKAIYYCLPVLIIVSCFVDRGWPHISFIHFFPVFLLGMFCSKHKDVVNPLVSQSRVIVVTLLLTLLLAIIEFRWMQGTMTYVNLLQKLAMSILLLGVLVKVNSYLTSRFVAIMADASFGVFFIHSYILTSGKMLFSSVFGDLPEGNLFLYGLVAAFTLLVCTLIIMLVQKMFGKHSRLLVGS